MALSTQTVVSDGTLTQLSLSIDFVTRSSIKVLFDNSEQALGTTWSWVGTTGGTIAFAPAVPNAVVVIVRRSTDLTAPTHQFNAGAQFNEASLDANFLQVLHSAQEVSEGATVKDSFVDFNLHGNRLTNLAAGTSASDAVNKAQLDAGIGTAPASAVSAAVSASAAAASAASSASSANLASNYKNGALIYRDSAQEQADAAASSAISASSSAASAAATLSNAALKGANNDITSLNRLASINGGQIGGLRNCIINGNFAINQREVTGTVTLAAGIYGHDRFKAGSAGCTYTFATALNVTTLTITAGSLQQVVEGGNLQSGAVVLSWQGTAQGKISAGSYAASGVTGTAVGGAHLTVEFGVGTLSKVQLEVGATSSAFEWRPVGIEWLMCQRYYPYLAGVKATGYGTAGAGYFTVGLPVAPRTAPTGINSSGVGAYSCFGGAGAVTVTGVAFNSATASGLTLTVSGGFAAGQAYSITGGDIGLTGCEL